MQVGGRHPSQGESIKVEPHPMRKSIATVLSGRCPERMGRTKKKEKEGKQILDKQTGSGLLDGLM